MDHHLLSFLRGGGYILYARHAEATVGLDAPNVDFTSCQTQRNLSLRGRAQALYYGNRLRQLGIPVWYSVTASPYCRTIETAQLAFPSLYTLIDPFYVSVNELGGMTPPEQTRMLNMLTARLEVMPPYRYNQSVIDHTFPNGFGLGPIPYMGTVVVRPLGLGNGYDIVARLSLEDLAR